MVEAVTNEAEAMTHEAKTHKTDAKNHEAKAKTHVAEAGFLVSRPRSSLQASIIVLCPRCQKPFNCYIYSSVFLFLVPISNLLFYYFSPDHYMPVFSSTLLKCTPFCLLHSYLALLPHPPHFSLVAWWESAYEPPITHNILRSFLFAEVSRSVSVEFDSTPNSNIHWSTFSVCMPSIWNSLKLPIRVSSTLTTFKRNLKTFHFAKDFLLTYFFYCAHH